MKQLRGIRYRLKERENDWDTFYDNDSKVYARKKAKTRRKLRALRAEYGKEHVFEMTRVRR